MDIIFHTLYYYWGKENHSYTEDLVIQRFVISSHASSTVSLLISSCIDTFTKSSEN